MILAYANPYHKSLFFDFFLTLISRVFLFLTGRLTLDDLVSDEIQILVLLFIAASASLIGCFLVLRRMTMLANSLSHTILFGIILAYLFLYVMNQGGEIHYHESLDFTTMLFAALAGAFVTTFFTEFLTRSVGLQEDASTGLVFTTLFALGVVMVTAFSRNAHIGAEVVMGNVNLLQKSDILLSFSILLINLILISALFKEFQMTSFDAGFANALGYRSTLFHYILMALTSITVVGAFRAVGVLLVLALLTGPPLTARLLTNRLKAMLGISVGIGAAASIVGVALARHLWSAYQLSLSTAGVVVCIIVLFFVLTALFAPPRGLFIGWLKMRRMRHAAGANR